MQPIFCCSLQPPEARRVDVLVVNAGISDFATLSDISEDHFDRTFNLNVRALLFAAKAMSGSIPTRRLNSRGDLGPEQADPARHYQPAVALAKGIGRVVPVHHP
ncbi:MAG: SDR family NAD(P)-dependent oxidoreductase [Janthinobacterium lividum]